MDFTDFVVPHGWGNDFPKLVPSIRNQAHSALVPSCALGAIAKRESEGRNIFQIGMAHGDPDCGYGYCQITYGADRTDPEHPAYHLDGRTFDLFDPSSNLYVAAKGFLAPAISNMLALRSAIGTAKMPEPVVYYAFAAYNAGSYRVARAIRGGGNVDAVTTANYASGVMALYNEALSAAHAV